MNAIRLSTMGLLLLGARASAATLELPPVARGCSVPISMDGLGPGETAYVFGGARIAPGPCSPSIGGACLGVAGGVRLLGEGTADDAGVATVSVPVPGGWPDGHTIGVQGLAIRGLSGADSLFTAPVEGAVVGCEPGCTDPTAPEFDPAATWDDGSCSAPLVVVEGSVIIESELDVLALDGVGRLTGDLLVVGSGMRTVTLPESLQVIDGAFSNSSDTVTTLEAPGLREVGELKLGRGLLTVAELPALTTAGDININGPELSLALPSLQSADSLWGTVAALSAPELTTLSGRITVFDCRPVCGSFDLALSLDLYGAPEAVDLGGLTDVDGGVSLWSDRDATMTLGPAHTQITVAAGAGATVALSLPTTEHLVGLTATDDVSVDAPHLAVVDGTLALFGAVADATLPALERAGGLTLSTSHLDAPRLTAVEGPVRLYNLSTVPDLSALESAGELVVTRCDAWSDLTSLDALSVARELDITSNACIEQVEAEAWALEHAEDPSLIEVRANNGPC